MTVSAPATGPTSVSQPTAGWLAAGIVIIVLAIVVITAALYATGSRETAYPAGSAEAALQGYYRAWENGDVDAAYGSLSSRAQRQVPERDFRETQRWSAEHTGRVWIEDTTRSGEALLLRVSIETSEPGLLGGERDRHETTLRMVREDGAWKIDTPLIGYDQW